MYVAEERGRRIKALPPTAGLPRTLQCWLGMLVIVLNIWRYVRCFTPP